MTRPSGEQIIECSAYRRQHASRGPASGGPVSNDTPLEIELEFDRLYGDDVDRNQQRRLRERHWHAKSPSLRSS